MNRQEALEWAADYVERAKIFEGASLSPDARLNMLSVLADSVVVPDVPRTIEKKVYPEADCISFVRDMTHKLRNATSKSSNTRAKYQKAINDHLDFLSGDFVTAHPSHDDPTEAAQAWDED